MASRHNRGQKQERTEETPTLLFLFLMVGVFDMIKCGFHVVSNVTSNGNICWDCYHFLHGECPEAWRKGR